MKNNVDVSVVLTANNTREAIEKQSLGIVESLQRAGLSYEIIQISENGHAGDGISAEGGAIYGIQLKHNFMESEALKVGVKKARGKIIVYIIGRVNVDTAGINTLIEKVKAGSDMVVGYRVPRSDSKLNQCVSRMFNFLTRRLTGLKLHDINSGVIVARREVYDKVPMYGDLDKFIPILAHRNGYKVEEEKIGQLPGTYRKSFYVKEYINRLLDIITVIFLANYAKKPLHLMGFFGLILAVIGMGINIYLFIYRITGMGGIAGRPLLLLGVLLLLIGIQMISIGLLGEMIIFTHARDVEDYDIEEIVE
jgi:dolichol-phosphate mannosyltransferase